MSVGRGGASVAIAGVPLLLVGSVVSFLLVAGSGSAATCNPAAGTPGVTVDASSLPAQAVAGYGPEQLANAAAVIAAGQGLGLGVRDQTIGVMTAMGESGLRVLDYGDRAGPDSRGLFQQRDNGAWGSLADRMDPATSATNFFKAMMRVTGREALEPTLVANRTQRNADPWHYARYWDAAVQVVEALAGVDTGLSAGTGAQVCAGATTSPGQLSPSGWAVPGEGPITSSYGMRVHPVSGVRRLHSGTDLKAGGCDGPIWAAQAGTVTVRTFDRAGNGTITVDHGGGVQTTYLHMYDNGMLVRVGDQVQAGQQIARTGSSGQSTGCHLHFGVIVNGTPTDPVPFMAAVSAPLG
ncbi:M23 family metallopeptidase [Aquipuribacter hungaricus]|uniref:M23 family metallopeptidase n=1 Tax=Aquipuribacter hungaricus TaxID=545624 RepID=A0ABV7WM31_9MICO